MIFDKVRGSPYQWLIFLEVNNFNVCMKHLGRIKIDGAVYAVFTFLFLCFFLSYLIAFLLHGVVYTKKFQFVKKGHSLMLYTNLLYSQLQKLVFYT